MPPSTTVPPSGHLEVGQIFTQIMAVQAHYTLIVTRAIRDTGRWRTYGWRSNLRNLYIITEDDVILLITSSRRIVELAYTIEPT